MAKVVSWCELPFMIDDDAGPLADSINDLGNVLRRRPAAKGEELRTLKGHVRVCFNLAGT